MIVGPAATAIAGSTIDLHMRLSFDLTSIVLWLSVVTWLVAGLVYWRIDRLRVVLRRAETAIGWTSDKTFDAMMFGLIRSSASVTRLLHHGRLEIYLVVVFAMLALALLVPLVYWGALPSYFPAFPELRFYEWGAIAVAVAGITTVVLSPTRLMAILALGVQGLGVALIYLMFGAPDLSFTQFMVESVSVVILALVMTRLHLERHDPRELEDVLRDGGLALICGLGVTGVLFAVLDGVLDPRLSEFFNTASAPLAHGHNVVNVILVDFRGLDTLGEITVVMTAGIAILALLRSTRHRAGETS
jgi:multicomponent Na+:H+ antiporter subunit A